MRSLEEYFEILYTLPGLNIEHFKENSYKYSPCLALIENVDELNNGIAYAQANNINLVSELGTLYRLELIRCVEKALNNSFDENMSQGRAM